VGDKSLVIGMRFTAHMRTSTERAATRAADRQRRALAQDVERAMADAGVSIRALARASGVDPGYLVRILAGSARPSLETYHRLAAGLRADLAVRLYPNTGTSLHDRHQAPMLEHLLGTAHPRYARLTEVGVVRPVRGWIDAVLHEPRERLLVASELESALRRLEQLVRWHLAKAEALPSWDGWSALRTGRHDEPAARGPADPGDAAARSGVAQQLRVAYPAHPDDALASLTGTAPWPGAALVWMTLDARGARWAPGR
jgi:transcriptional regulator with XRE-family HTH domain